MASVPRDGGGGKMMGVTVDGETFCRESETIAAPVRHSLARRAVERGFAAQARASALSRPVKDDKDDKGDSVVLHPSLAIVVVVME
jgi:hypothetical protein